MRSCGRPAVGCSTLAVHSEQRRFSGSGGDRFAKGWAGCWVLLPRACDPSVDVADAVTLARRKRGGARRRCSSRPVVGAGQRAVVHGFCGAPVRSVPSARAARLTRGGSLSRNWRLVRACRRLLGAAPPRAVMARLRASSSASAPEDACRIDARAPSPRSSRRGSHGERDGSPTARQAAGVLCCGNVDSRSWCRRRVRKEARLPSPVRVGLGLSDCITPGGAGRAPVRVRNGSCRGGRRAPRLGVAACARATPPSTSIAAGGLRLGCTRRCRGWVRCGRPRRDRARRSLRPARARAGSRTGRSSR